MRSIHRQERLARRLGQPMTGTISAFHAQKSRRLKTGDQRLADFSALGLDVEAIVDWTNCQDPASRQNRIRFVETYPVLVPMLVWNSDAPFSSEIIEWIDDDKPLVENIAGLMGDVDPETIQFLAKKPLSLISGRWLDEELDLVFALSCVPADQRPQSKADWEVFADYWRAICPTPWAASGQIFRELCCLGYGATHLKKLGLSSHELRKLRWVRDYLDFLTMWAKSVAKPATNVVQFSRKVKQRSRGDLGPEDAWVKQYFSGFSDAAIFNQALAWRIAFQDAIAMAQRDSNDPELVQWPALFRQPVICDQVRVVSLTTLEEAMRDGAVLRHFDDDGFIEACSLGDGYLVVLKDQDGHHISSAMIRLVADGDQVFPYRGAHHRPNGDYAHQREVGVLDQALDWLRHPDQQAWLLALVDYHAARRERIREKLDALEKLSIEAATRVLDGVVVDLDGAVSALSSSRL